MKTYVITSAIIKFKEKYLIAKRSKIKKFAPNKWEFISGFVEEHKTAEEVILNELNEELKLSGVIKKTATPYILEDKEGRWIIIPFLIELQTDNFFLNEKDHSEAKFVSKKELENYSDLKEEIKQLNKVKLL